MSETPFDAVIPAPDTNSSDEQVRPSLRRPDAEQGWSQRLSSRLNTYRDRRSRQRELQREAIGIDTRPDTADLGSPAEGSAWLTAAIAIGAVTLSLGLLWAWQSWSQRSALPIDELLPVLVSTDGSTSSAAVAGAELPASESSSAGSVSTSPAAGEAASLDAAREQSGLDPSAATPDPTAAPSIIVHVSGAVLRPGVVQLSAGSRVFEAVASAGGALETSDLDRVNLAAAMVDGERIHIPEHGEEDPPVLVQPDRPAPAADSGPASETAAPTHAHEPVDINHATMLELEELPGVGPSIAQAIVGTRDERGPFLDIEELLEVPGIGESKLALLRPLVTTN